jgi:indole-3-glycerol phosphate synthase
MILDGIVSRTRERVSGLGTITATDTGYRPKSLARAIRGATGKNAVIAELKYASPSRGMINVPCPPPVLADELVSGGAVALSVLTEPYFFGGRPENLIAIRERTEVPLLRKDFIIDLRQLDETKALKADAVLLIARLLGRDLPAFVEAAFNLGLEPLVEVHSEDDVVLALETHTGLIGINNRDLETGVIDLTTTTRLSKRILNKGRVIVSESGICWPCDIRYLKNSCNAFLIGSAITSSRDPRKRVEGFVCE